LIGIGRDENNSVKISLFDASNVSAPVELSKYSVIGEWSDTPVLTEHKALLFDKSGNLLVIPVSIYESSYGKDGPSYWLWQGALIFKVTLSDGFTYRGAATHQRAEGDYWNQSFWVKREFYIDNVLYTVSDMKLKLNNLEDLTFIKEITLN
jgi:inhibitor of cysteine peptidase